MHFLPPKKVIKNNIAQFYNLKLILNCLVFIFIFAGYVSSFDGFVLYSKGNAGNRTLHMKEFSANGEFGPEKMICERGPEGGDIEGQISFDGKMVAFARSLKGTGPKHGGNDYHIFLAWDIYVVRIDGELPATPKRVANGYWPSWSADSYNPNKKTLYYGYYPCRPWVGNCRDCSIKKCTVDAEGTPSDTQVVVDGGLLQFPFMSPDGNFVGHASGASNILAKYVAGPMKGQEKTVGRKGCHTSVSGDSKWVLAASGQVGRADGSWSGRSGLASYHFATSQDMKWAVGRSGGGAQNNGSKCNLFALNTADNKWNVKSIGTFVNNGSWVDVHGYSDPPTSNKISKSVPQPMIATISQQGIYIKLEKSSRYEIEIVDPLGRRAGFIQSKSLLRGKNFIAWSDILDNYNKKSISDVYFVRIKTERMESVQKWVF